MLYPYESVQNFIKIGTVVLVKKLKLGTEDPVVFIGKHILV